MSEEMQAGDVSAPEEMESGIDLGQPEEATESSTEQTTTEQQVTFDEAQQAKVDSIVAGKVHKQRQAERELAALKQQMQQSQAQQAQPERPNIPTLPDPLDVSEQEYQAALKARDEAIRGQQNYDYQANLAQQQQVAANQQLQLQQQEEAKEAAKGFMATATKLGFSEDKVNQDAQAVAGYGGVCPNDPAAGGEIANRIIADPDGPKIIAYLAENPMALLNLQNMHPIDAMTTIHTDIRSKASGLGKKITNTPAPVDHLSGNGAAPRERGPSGATYE